MYGVTGEVQGQASGSAHRFVSDFLNSMHPISLRKAGIYHDRATLAALPEAVFRLERIAVPTLVVHARDDGLQPYAHGVNTATRVPGAVFASYERGGHMLLLQYEEVRRRIDAFLAKH
jgi:pimeloyl-ACP methyl ester carboxylesterase